MLRFSKTLSLAVALLMPLAATSQAAPLKFSPIVSDVVNENVIEVGAKLSGKQKLKRLMRPHSRWGNPITQDVRDATGDPDIVVLDRRGGSDDVYRCSYITLQGKRALTCD